MIDVVGERDLAQRLAGGHALRRLARLVLGQLRRAAEPCALGHGAHPAFVGPLQDQIALELGNAG